MGRSKKKTRRRKAEPERRVVKRREVILEYDDGTIERKVHVEGPTGRRLVERSLRAGDYPEAARRPPSPRLGDMSAHDLRDPDPSDDDDDGT